MKIIGDITLSLATGLISGLMVTLYYRKKDAKRETKKYLYEVREYALKLSNYIIPLCIAPYDYIDKITSDKVIDDFPKIPTRFKWYKFSKKSMVIIEKFEELNNEIKKNCMTLINCYLQKKYNNLYEDKKDISKKEEKIQKELLSLNEILTVELIKKLNELAENDI